MTTTHTQSVNRMLTHSVHIALLRLDRGAIQIQYYNYYY